jgi:hypothetical protein
MPALVERAIDRGRVVLFAISPVIEWSQFGSRAGPMIVLMHTMLSEIAPPPDNVAVYTAGERVSRSFGPQHAELQIDRPGDQPALSIRNAEGPIGLPTDIAGHYRVRTSDGTIPLLAYAVNVARGESDASRIDPATILARLPEGLALVVDDPDALGQAQRQHREGVSLKVLAALALLTLLIVETFFANRFYALRTQR